MKRTTIFTIVAFPFLMAAPFVTTAAFADDDNNGSREATVLQARATLPISGAMVACTLTSRRDVLIPSFYTDNTPTTGGMKGFTWDAISVAESNFNGGRTLPLDLASGGNRSEMRDMLRMLEAFNNNSVSFAPIPLQAKKEFVVTFSTIDGQIQNDIELDVIVGVIGAKKAKLECEEGDPIPVLQ